MAQRDVVAQEDVVAQGNVVAQEDVIEDAIQAQITVRATQDPINS
jgi:hypothetical protein